MHKHARWAIPLAGAAAAGMVGIALALPGAASAAEPTTYQATLSALNGASGSGSITVSLDGDQATVTEHYTGLATTFSGNPYPHVQHIHIDGQGQCPSTSADTNSDGVISTTEGQPAYGAIGTTLSTSGDTSAAAATTLTVAPSGGSADYNRTFTMNADTIASLKAGTAVVVVHGLDPATLSSTAQGEMSDIVPSLPLAATSPALCGVLAVSQMSTIPGGAPNTGGGSTSGIEDEALIALGGGLVLAAGVAFAAGRRFARQG
jgi:hypothetical protein